MNIFISCLCKFSQTVSQNLWQYISSNKSIQTYPISTLEIFTLAVSFFLFNNTKFSLISSFIPLLFPVIFGYYQMGDISTKLSSYFNFVFHVKYLQKTCKKKKRYSFVVKQTLKFSNNNTIHSLHKKIRNCFEIEAAELKLYSWTSIYTTIHIKITRFYLCKPSIFILFTVTYRSISCCCRSKAGGLRYNK